MNTRLKLIIEELIQELEHYIPESCICDLCMKSKRLIDKAKNTLNSESPSIFKEIEEVLEKGRMEKEA